MFMKTFHTISLPPTFTAGAFNYDACIMCNVAQSLSTRHFMGLRTGLYVTAIKHKWLYTGQLVTLTHNCRSINECYIGPIPVYGHSIFIWPAYMPMPDCCASSIMQPYNRVTNCDFYVVGTSKHLSRNLDKTMRQARSIYILQGYCTWQLNTARYASLSAILI